MTGNEVETCPGCGVILPKSPGPTHRYIGASAACWELFTLLNGAGEPPMAPAAANALLTDAYAAQHPGVPSDQSIQSVAVHLITLYGILERGVGYERIFELRTRPLRQEKSSKRGRFVWLTPPFFADTPNILDVVKAPDPQARSARAAELVQAVWNCWRKEHGNTVQNWYEQWVLAE